MALRSPGRRRKGASMILPKPLAFEGEIERVAGLLQVSLRQIEVGAVQYRELIEQPAPAVRLRRALIFDEERLERRYLSAIPGGVHVGHIVGH